MATGYDGTIRIDTSIDAKGFKAGLSKLEKVASNSMKGVLSVIKGVGVAAAVAVVSIVAIVAALTAGLAVIITFGVKLFEVFDKSISKSSEYYDEVTRLKAAFRDLKGALMEAFTPFLIAIMPYLIQAVEWLTKMVDLAAQYIAAFLGQKTIMRYVGTVTKEAADEAERLARATDKAQKAARGALAAFDQLDVLNKPQQQEFQFTGTQAGIIFEEQPIEDKVLETTDKIKEWFKETWEKIKGWALDAWEKIKSIWNGAGEWFGNLWRIISDWSKWAFGLILIIWAGLAIWFYNHVIKPLLDFWVPVFIYIYTLAHDAQLLIMAAWALMSAWFYEHVTKPILTFFIELWISIWNKAQEAKDKLSVIWGTIGEWFKSHVVDPIKDAFLPMFAWISEKFGAVFDGLKIFAKNALNGIIDLINKLLARLVQGVNSIADTLNNIGGEIPGWITIPHITAPQIPRLATGAVIPPNAQFAAILGDQRSGKNLEAPENLIRQIIKEEIGNIDAKIDIGFTGSMSQLIRELKPHIDKENVRVGGSLIKSGVVR